MSEPLFVDPDRLAQHGKPYAAAAHDWYRLHETVGDIQARYNGAWGDDQIGSQFGPSFVEGMDSVVLRAKAVGDTLGYYGEGLVESGKIYGDAGDAADEGTRSFLLDSEYVGGQEAPEGARYFGVRSVQPEATPRMYVGIESRKPEEGEPRLYQGIRSTHMAETPGHRVRALSFSEDGEPLESGMLVEGRLLGGAPNETQPPLQRAQHLQGRLLGVAPTESEPQLMRGQVVPGRLLGGDPNETQPPLQRAHHLQSRLLGVAPTESEPQLMRGQVVPGRLLGEDPNETQPPLERGQLVEGRLLGGAFRSVHQEPQEEGFLREPAVEGQPLLLARYDAVDEQPALLGEPALPAEIGVEPVFYRSVNPLLPVEPPPAESE